MSEQNPDWSDTMEGHVVNFIIHTVKLARPCALGYCALNLRVSALLWVLLQKLEAYSEFWQTQRF